MSQLQGIRERANTIGAFCQSDLWPLIEDFREKSKIDFSPLKEGAILAAPLLGGGFLVLKLVESKITAGGVVGYLAAACVAMILVGVFIFLRALMPILRRAAQIAQELIRLRSEIRSRTVSYLDSSFTFEPKPVFPAELVKATGLFSEGYDRAEAEDRICGRLDQTKFDLIEISTWRKEERKNSKGQKQVHWVSVFKGLLFRADFNKNFVGRTLVQTDRYEKNLGFLARAAQRAMTSFSDAKIVELESPEFEEHFKVHATDAIEARYLLTPVLMEQMLALKTKFNVELQFAFLNKSLVVVIPHSKDFLALGYDLGNLTESVEQMASELVSVLAIVEDLELNSRIWNKNSEKVGA